jgi:hypothetical protein
MAILVVVLGCGGDPTVGDDLHTVTTCDVSTGSAGQPCERACATHHDVTGISCQAHSISPTPDGTAVTCTSTFGIDGTIGCCIVLPGETVGRYAECEN